MRGWALLAASLFLSQAQGQETNSVSTGTNAVVAVDQKPTAATDTGSAGNPVISDLWKLMTSKGKSIGFEHVVIRKEGNHFITEAHEESLVERQGYNLKTVNDTVTVEDPDGQVLSFERTFKTPQSAGRLTANKQGDQFVIDSPGVAPHVVSAPLVGTIGPAALFRSMQSLKLEKGTKAEFKTFSTDHPDKSVKVTAEVIDKESHDTGGGPQDLWKVMVTDDSSNEDSVANWTKDDHTLLTEEVYIPGFGLMIERVSSKDECSKPLDGVEVFTTSLIRPDRTLLTPTKLGKAVYLLTVQNYKDELPIWKGDASTQEVLKSEPGKAQVAVYSSDFAPENAGFELPLKSTPNLADYMKPSRYLESDSIEVKTLAQDALQGERNPVIAARRIETYVRYYITKKDLRLGFLTARATAICREGDCKEHAVLCAAMGRAAGMPTRCVVGLCYVAPNEDLYANVTGDVSHGIFGFHMWAEAYVGPNEWMPMDAALYGYDVGHIALGKTALDEDHPDFESSISGIVGNLSIKILDTDLNNRPLPTPKPTQSPVQQATSNSVD